MKIKLGLRYNLIYLLMLIICTTLRRIIQTLISEWIEYRGPFLLSLLIFTSEIFGGLLSIFILFPKNEFKSSELNKFTVKLIQGNNKMTPLDNGFKICLLIFCIAYFDFIGSIVRNISSLNVSYSNTTDNFQQYVRSLQIFSSSLLCYYTIRLNIYKHQFVSLIIIFICLIILVIIEFINGGSIMSFLFACFSCIQRSFLDTIQYYLFEFNFLNPFKVLLIQGLLTTSFMIPYYFLDIIFNKKDNIEDFTEIISLSEKDDNSNFIFLILLLIAYFITSVFKNIYIIYTIKLFSPMARALSESIFDTFIISYYFLTDDNKEKNFQFYITFIINIICSLLIAFFSCIYNELLILYYKGMEINTHLEIMKRSNQKMNSYDFDSVGHNCNYINNTNSNIDSNEKNNDDNNDDDSDYKSEYSEHS